mgnify:CR=1 FL=1
MLQIVACKHKLQSKIPVAKRTRSVQCKEMAELKGGGLCRPDCVSLPRVITYGVNPAHFNKDDHQSPPKTLRVANVNNVAGRKKSSILPKILRVVIINRDIV